MFSFLVAFRKLTDLAKVSLMVRTISIMLIEFMSMARSYFLENISFEWLEDTPT